jgi:hypothetical protein
VQSRYNPVVVRLLQVYKNKKKGSGGFLFFVQTMPEKTAG